MANTLLKVDGLKTWFYTPEGIVRAVDGIDFDIRRGETIALLGESGCGKSVTALSLLQLVAQPAGRIVGGRAELEGRDILALPERAMRRVRGRRIATIFQEPQTSLNPVLTIGTQIAEALPSEMDSAGKRRRAVELLEAVGIGDPQRRHDEFPHQMSGGMKQRVMIATALAAEPELLIADEPTTALDVTIQAQILALLKSLQQKTGMAILLITHDLGVVAEMADRIAVMYAGEIVEFAPRAQFFAEPRHPYTRKLFQSLPSARRRGQDLEVIPGSVPSLIGQFTFCRFAERCDFVWDLCRKTAPRWIERDGGGVRCHLHDPGVTSPPDGAKKREKEPVRRPTVQSPGESDLLRVRDLKVHFPIQRGVLRRTVGYVKAVDGVSLAISRGRTLALVGESGCGKTTVGKGILQLIRPSAGSVMFRAQELTEMSQRALRAHRREFQIIFQDPYASLNPRMLVGDVLEEGLQSMGFGDAAARTERVSQLLRQVGLAVEARNRYPHEFSGGQRQRISIARALSVNPKLIICDEPTSALDVSVQAQILNLLKRLQDEMGLSYLFITHNLAVVEYLAHEVAVMYLGRIVERGPTLEVLERPKHPYTQALLAAIPAIEQTDRRAVIRLQGDIPSPSDPPSGCHFHPRCAHVMPVCRENYPGTTRLSESHETRCFLYSTPTTSRAD
jgi:oligopeptide/dipeptide ABC transporter ATP-binding protein